jgi:hypothetical protein
MKEGYGRIGIGLPLPALTWLGLVWFGFTLFHMIQLSMTWLGNGMLHNCRDLLLAMEYSVIVMILISLICSGMLCKCGEFHNT